MLVTLLLVASTIVFQPSNCCEQHLELVTQKGCSSTWLKNLFILIFICIIFCIILGFLLYSLVDHIRSSRAWKEHEAKRVRKKPIRRISYPITMDHNPYAIDILTVFSANQRYRPSHNSRTNAVLSPHFSYYPWCVSTDAHRWYCSSRYSLAYQDDVSTPERRNVDSLEYHGHYDI